MSPARLRRGRLALRTGLSRVQPPSIACKRCCVESRRAGVRMETHARRPRQQSDRGAAGYRSRAGETGALLAAQTGDSEA